MKQAPLTYFDKVVLVVSRDKVPQLRVDEARRCTGIGRKTYDDIVLALIERNLLDRFRTITLAGKEAINNIVELRSIGK